VISWGGAPHQDKMGNYEDSVGTWRLMNNKIGFCIRERVCGLGGLAKTMAGSVVGIREKAPS